MKINLIAFFFGRKKKLFPYQREREEERYAKGRKMKTLRPTYINKPIDIM